MSDDLDKTPNPFEDSRGLRPERLGPVAPLRPERLGQHEVLQREEVQREELRPERLGEPLTAREVDERLVELPGWETCSEGTALARTFAFPTLRAAVTFVALVTEVGEAEGYVPEIDLRLLEVTVRVDTQAGEALTDLDFRVARSLVALGLEAR